MTTEGEQQEAVCGTCGGRIRRVGVGNNPGTLRGALVCENGHAIPAPVVPSDDERCDECGHVLTWGCHGPAQDRLISILGGELEFPHPFHAPGTGGMYADKQKAAAPPTSSQDAEGDGRKALLLRIKRMTGREPVGMGDLLNILTHPDCIRFTEAWLESAIREPYEALVQAARDWSARVEYDGQFALVIEWPGEPPYGRYWWVLCPAAATLHDDPPSEDEDPTEHDHGACSLSPECDFNELHALAHQAIRDRAAALESLGGRKDG